MKISFDLFITCMQRNFRSPHSTSGGLDSASRDSEDSYYGGAEECIQEWLPSDVKSTGVVDHPRSSELMTAALGVEMSTLHVVKEGTHESASSDADDSSVPLLSSTNHLSEATAVNNTTVRKRT